MTGSFCQSGLGSNAPSDRPSLSTLTEVAYTPSPIIYLSWLIFCSNYYYRKLPYLFIYLFIGSYPLSVSFSTVPPAHRIVLDTKEVLRPD